ncbi:MAG TPA: hypothetical protein ACQGQJ_01980, partial [Xylella fastidiosa subsp. multiplex]
QTVLKDPIPDSGTPGRMLSMGLLGGGGVVTGGLIPTLATIAGWRNTWPRAELSNARKPASAQRRSPELTSSLSSSLNC